MSSSDFTVFEKNNEMTNTIGNSNKKTSHFLPVIDDLDLYCMIIE